jgi:riboflavin biosynthesis pyrimidine reductase
MSAADSSGWKDGFDLSSFEATYVRAHRPAPAGRPWVMTNFVISPDGSAAVDGRVGVLSDPVDQHLFRLLRSIADVIMVGAGTVRAEGYGPHNPSPEHRAARIGRGQPPTAPLAVVTAGCDLDPTSALFASSEAGPLVITGGSAPRQARERLAASAEVVLAGDDQVDLAEALRLLAAAGARLVLCEGGPALLSRLLDEGLVDEMCVTIAPVLLADPVRMLPSGSLTARTNMILASHREHGGHLFLRYLMNESREPPG